MEGYIKLYKKMLKWEWYDDTNTKILFLHCLLKANWCPTKWHGVELQPGQFITSLATLAKETRLSVRQVRVALDHLIMTNEVTSKSQSKYRIITVNSWNEYQGNDKQNDKQVTSKRQASDKQVTSNTATIEQYNKNNKGTKKQTTNTLSASREADDHEDYFGMFWMTYPKKVAKAAALKAWKKIDPDDVTAGQIFASLEKWIESDEWTRDGGRYIPYPATWLNGRRWEDEIPVSKPVVKPAAKAFPVQDFEQRDYSSEQDDWTNRLLDWGKGGSI